MPKKTKADLERELKTARKILENITNCFERDNPEDIVGDCYNKLALHGDLGELNGWLDEARDFLK